MEKNSLWSFSNALLGQGSHRLHCSWTARGLRHCNLPLPTLSELVSGLQVIAANLGKSFLEPPGFNLEKFGCLAQCSLSVAPWFTVGCVAVPLAPAGLFKALAPTASHSSLCCPLEPTRW